MAPSSRPRDGHSPLSLPPEFIEIRELAQETVPANNMVSIIGVVKDCMLPIETSGRDHKMRITLFDKSTEDDCTSITLNIFRPKEEMPVVTVADVVLVRSAKVSQWNGNYGLLTNRATDICVYSASKIPEPPESAAPALAAPTRKLKKAPIPKEHEFVSWLFHTIDKLDIPDENMFTARANQSLNAGAREKFAQLKDVKEHCFHDLIVRVVKEPYADGEVMTLWVTDFTENAAFFNHCWSEEENKQRDDDPYGYMSKFSAAPTSHWPGPFGRRSLQVSCWEPNASVVRNRIKPGQWIRLSNVQVKYGRSATNLEGFLREERGFYASTKINVDVMDLTQDRENIDPRLKDAIKRQLTYEKTMKKQMKEFKRCEPVDHNRFIKHRQQSSDQTTTTNKQHQESQAKKRKAPEEEPKQASNTKSRRKDKRGKKAKKAAKSEQIKQREEVQEDQLPDLNALVKCENDDQRHSLISSVLEPVFYSRLIDGIDTKLRLPFINARHRIHVRVTDFRPRLLEDFAVSRKVDEYEILSDRGDVSSSSASSEDSSGSENEPGTPDGFVVGQRVWEWRFALHLEDASPRAGAKPASLWAVVDDTDAQLLTGLDACDLRRDEDTLNSLRERLFCLWGDLEEKKKTTQPARVRGGPPPDSSDDEDGSGSKRKPPGTQVRNMPFACCLRQYGVKTRARGEEVANAGEGKKWQRVFGLFGTKICA